jgi:hypothetical protein
VRTSLGADHALGRLEGHHQFDGVEFDRAGFLGPARLVVDLAGNALPGQIDCVIE